MTRAFKPNPQKCEATLRERFKGYDDLDLL
jgi:hypothetical protein